MRRVGRRKIVLLGMMTKMPVAGVVWETAQYLRGFELLGYDAYYVEAHARTPGALMLREEDDGSALAAAFIRDSLAPFGLGDRWAFHALHEEKPRVLGMSERELMCLYSSAEAIVNLYAGTIPRPEHYETGRLVLLDTDPCELQIELYERDRTAIEFLEPHAAFFTWAENYARPGCGLPVTELFDFKPTRMPIVSDFWLGGGADSGYYTTIGNWNQPWRNIVFRGERYTWSKDVEFRKFLELPSRVEAQFELALSSYEQADRDLLQSRGWNVRHGLDVSTDLESYRSYVLGSRGEFTVAKDQNVRLKSGWFSDRSAAYLAAGRPVVTQDTGYGCALPTGEGLFAFETADDIVAAIETIEADYARARRAAFDVVREYFDARLVLGRMLEEMGISLPGTRAGLPSPLPPTLDLSVVSRRPTTLTGGTLEAVLQRPLPETGGDCLPARAREVSVVVVAADGLPFTRMCLESLLVASGELDVEVVAVDNASSDGTSIYLAELAERDSRVRVLRNEQNQGFAPAINQGVEAATGSLLVVLNNDTIVPPGSLSRLLSHLERPQAGVVGAVTNEAGNEAELDTDYRTLGELVSFAHARAQVHTGVSFEIDVATFFCAAFRRDVWQRIGPLDEQFEVGMFEDDDYALRVRGAGLRVQAAEDVFIHHFGEGSFGHLFESGQRSRVFEENKRRYEAKWDVTWEPHVRRHNGWYRELVEQIRDVADRELPPDATVLVVSNGDDELLRLGAARRGWHFPQQEDGVWAGYYPADSREAIAHVEALRDKGARWILFPQTGFWWLEFYAGVPRCAC